MLPLNELANHIREHLAEGAGGVAEHLTELQSADIAELLSQLTLSEAAAVSQAIDVARAIDVFDQPTLERRAPILEQLDRHLAASILEGLSADQRTEVIRQMSPYGKRRLLPELSAPMRREVEQLIQYPERTAGGIMTTEFVRLDPGMSVAEALRHIREVGRQKETIYACYVLEPGTEKLIGSVSLRDLVMADPETKVVDVMRKHPVSINVCEDQEKVAQKISKYNLLAVPVLEDDGRIVGFVTVDDVIDVMVEEQTEDILRMGAVEPGALDQPYMAMPFYRMVTKRATWLVILFVGEMLTATAMGFFEGEIAKAVVLALFVPLIISSGGNSGSQATTLVIRALALREISLRDWWRVFRRELLTGIALGLVLGVIGILRIGIWSAFSDIYGPHWGLVALTVGLSLVGIVTWGTLAGSMLPFILKRLGVDPATSSSPFVATLVDVTGLIIYFTVAMLVLRGSML